MILLHCTDECCNKNYISCLYLCPNSKKKKCQSWNSNIDKIEAEPVDTKYIERYGNPTYYRKPEPKRRTVTSTYDKPKLVPKQILDQPKKRKRRTKQEMEADRSNPKGENSKCLKDVPTVKSGKKSSEKVKSKKDQSSTAMTVTEDCSPKKKQKTKVEPIISKPKRKRRTKAEMALAKLQDKTKGKPRKPKGDKK